MTDFVKDSLAHYLDTAASGEPTPGGGSVAALAGALAASMASMVGAFTLSSKKCADHHARAGELRAESEAVRTEMARLVQADVDAYAVVAAAFAMPKASEEEKNARRTAIRDACRTAIEPPLATMRATRRLAIMLPELAEIGNKNLISDAGVAARLCLAAFESAVLNVRINLGSIGDDPLSETAPDEIDAARTEVTTACEKTLSLVDAALG